MGGGCGLGTPLRMEGVEGGGVWSETLGMRPLGGATTPVEPISPFQQGRYWEGDEQNWTGVVVVVSGGVKVG